MDDDPLDLSPVYRNLTHKSSLFGLTPLDSAGSAVGVTMVILAAAVLALPAHVVQLVGLVVTYAEQRAHEGPVNAARLAGELG